MLFISKSHPAFPVDGGKQASKRSFRRPLMIIRKEGSFFLNYKIVKHLFGLSYGETYLVAREQTNEKFYLVEWDRNLIPPSADEEMQIWLTGRKCFPEIVERWDEKAQPALLVPEFQGICILKWAELHASSRLSAPEVESFLGNLIRLFEEAHVLQISLKDPLYFANKLYHTLPDQIVILPTPLLGIFEYHRLAMEPLRKEASAIPQRRYARMVAELFSYLMTGHLPKPGEQLDGVSGLDRAKEKLIQKAIAGKIEDFRSLDPLLPLVTSEIQVVEPTKPKAESRSPRPPSAVWSRVDAVTKTPVEFLSILPLMAVWVLNYYVVHIKTFLSRVGKARPKLPRISFRSIQVSLKKPQWGERVSPGENLLRFTEGLAVMTNAGVPINKALQVLAAQTEALGFKETIQRISADLTGRGLSLSTLMSRYPRVFPSDYVNLIRSGETGGELASVLLQTAAYLEKAERFKKKIKSASTYPLFVGTLCIVVFALFFYLALPRILAMVFEGIDVSFPLPTLILIHFVQWTHSSLAFLIFGLGLLAAVPLPSFFQTEEGKLILDRVKIGIPLFGPLYQRILLTRFCGTLGSLLRTGVPLGEALVIAGEATGNSYFSQSTKAMIERLEAGASLERIMGKLPFHSELACSMVSVGEQAGNVDAMLIRASLMYESEVDYALDQFVGFFEPALVLSMGFIVGFVVLSIFLPVYSAISSLSAE